MNWYDASMHQIADRLFSLDVSLIAYPLVFLGGLLTNLCPCNIALMPIVLGGAGGFSFKCDRSRAMLYSAVFSAGIVATLCGLGGFAALAGTTLLRLRTYCLGFVALVSVMMGLHSLGLMQFALPGLVSLSVKQQRRGLWGIFALGLTAGIVSSPCTTPVLAVILTYVAVQARLLYGISLLFAYALGFVVPLLLAGVFADLILRMNAVNDRTHYRKWIAKGSGVLLIAFGLYLTVKLFE